MQDASLAKPVWLHADAYERYMGRWSRQVAPPFLRWLDRPAGQRWVDVGCGTGALSAAVLARCAPARVTGVDPSEGFLRKAREQLGDRAELHCASGDALPLAGGCSDATVAALMLNFAADPAAVVKEMARVTAAGGCVAAYVWDYGGRMDLIRGYWDAARELDPTVQSQDTGPRVALCRPEALAALFEQCGLAQVATRAVDIAMHFANFDDYWQPFLGGQGPAPAHAMGLPAPQREQLRERLRQRFAARAGDAFELGARAWAVRGIVAT
jgi:SAM-dependent methyltransferase